MRQKRYSDVISQAEVLATNPNSYTRRGVLKSRVERKINRLANKAVFLTQFETPELVTNY
jgi:hypothetical protein